MGVLLEKPTDSPALKEPVILQTREHRLSVRKVCATFTIPAFSRLISGNDRMMKGA
ncbi:hypothetical protein EPIR_0939 [Erwinia piriflorinigrans CFBP 5888]|uniref:Uncharacterized protein n=1 Tax=Erwinia piriflorinigrans CFBP 5888 TaxID=1161919 RepID=V5Z5Q4_9GAMM|nr:hypothetical protein EPIR_0939 [Erwinia piriflorinigrans CFBP 5888]